MNINSIIKLFPLVMTGLFIGCASTKTQDTITLDLAEVVTYEAEEPAPVQEQKPELLQQLEVKVSDETCFGFDSVSLTEEGKDALQEVANTLKNYPESLVVIVGHTCSMGDPYYNIDLSQRRAEAVRSVLQQQYGVTNPISIEGKGASEPKVSNETMDGRRANRRVEIFIFK